MPGSARTRVSTRGQVVLPKDLRERRGWAAGVELIVEDRPEGVLLRLASVPSRFEDVCGSLRGEAGDRIVSIEEMNEAVLEEARARWRRKGFARD